MADTSVKLSGTYDSIEAYNIMVEMQNMSADYEEIRTEAAAAASAATAAVTTAQTAANSASTYAGNAQTYAGNANSSASEAADYAANADTSATNAAASETNASNSASAAATSAANAAASEAVVNGALPLSGGTMTGDIASNFAYKNTVDNGAFKVYAGTDATGSAIFMYGKDAPSFAGYFQIKCGDGVNDASLIGSPTGSLTWDGNTVATTKVDTTTISASPVGDGVFTVSRVGGVGFLYLSNLKNLAASQYTSVTAKLPVGYRPSYTFVKTVTLISGTTSRSNIVVRVQNDGSVSFFNYGAAVTSAQLVYEMIAYPIGG